MKHPPILLLYVSLGALSALAGGVLAWSSSIRKSGEEQSAHPTSSSERHQTGSPLSPARGRPEVLRQTWDLLAAETLPRREKHELQKRLLAQWADVDLDAALQTAAAHPVRGYHDEFSPTLFAAFREKIRENPERFWPAIREHRFGYDTGELRHEWITQTAKVAPTILLGHLDDLGPGSRTKAVVACLERRFYNPKIEQEVKEVLDRLPDTADNGDLKQAAARTLARP